MPGAAQDLAAQRQHAARDAIYGPPGAGPSLPLPLHGEGAGWPAQRAREYGRFILLLNYAYPLTEAQLAQTTALTGKRFAQGNTARVEVVAVRTLKSGRVIVELKPAAKRENR